jgi:putative hydrolase of the HAD superfamily
MRKDQLEVMSLDIIFDLGGVVLTWDPRAIIAGVFVDEASQALVLSEVFEHHDWVELDRGTMPLEAAIAGAASRTGLPEADLARMFRGVLPALVPVPQMVALLHRLKARGHSLYCLSNMHADSLAHLKASYTFLGLFHGAVFSCLVQLCKPEPAIYAHMLETFGLSGPETLFIDDMEVNLEAAKPFGIRTIRFVTQLQCEWELELIGCL